LYLSNRRKLGEVFQRLLDGSDRDSLVLSQPSAISEVVATVDGEWLVYRVGANAAADLYAKRLAGDPIPVPLATSEFLERGAEVSPDGRYLAYTSTETGPDEVYLRPFPRTSDGKWLVSTAGGLTPLWSRDGRELFYRNQSGDLVAVEITPGTPPIGRQRVLFSALPYVLVPTRRSYDVTPDGRRFLMMRRVGTPAAPVASLIVVENFFEELKAKATP